MLLNLSNHPSTGWSDEQLTAAHKDFGAVVDLPFPAVDPESDDGAVKLLALKYLGRVLQSFTEVDGEHAVHVMGESGFVYFFVTSAHNVGVRCFHSTSARDVWEDAETGKKVVQFRFVRFRSY